MGLLQSVGVIAASYRGGQPDCCLGCGVTSGGGCHFVRNDDVIGGHRSFGYIGTRYISRGIQTLCHGNENNNCVAAAYVQLQGALGVLHRKRLGHTISNINCSISDVSEWTNYVVYAKPNRLFKWGTEDVYLKFSISKVMQYHAFFFRYARTRSPILLPPIRDGTPFHLSDHHKCK